MADLLGSMAIASSGMTAQAQRLRHISENIANVDTPGYRRKMITFRQELEGVKTGKTLLDRRETAKHFNPSHPLADDRGYFQGSNVDLVLEMADAREAQRSYEANLKIFEQSRQMVQSLFDLLRR